MDELNWFVAHTKPRCEKKLIKFTDREGLNSKLPCLKAVHKYRGKTVSFDKPLFPNYVFFRLLPHQRRTVYQSDYVANLLDVPDQAEFEEQLQDILRALETELDIMLAPHIGEGDRVLVKRGPLQGTEGFVEKRYGMTTVMRRLDFIGQAAAVKVEADDLELV